MRFGNTFVAAGLSLGLLAACVLIPREASAQGVPPIVERDENWGTVSHVTTALAASTVFLMPRVYYSDPEATVGWKGRWHLSMFAPAMTMTAITLFVDGPLKNAIGSTRPGCTEDQTTVAFPDSNCESFGGPSSHAFAAWGSTGAGLGIFLVDTLKYSNGRFHAGAFIGNVGVPLTLSIFASVGRGIDAKGAPFESAGQVVAGTLPGFLIGAGIGAAYAVMQRPSCGYGNALICW